MKQVMDGANPTVVQARITAKKMGIRACMMYASTPGDLETDEGRDFQKIIDNLTVFNENMYDLTEEEIEYMKDPAYDPNNPDKVPVTMLYIEFDYIQLRKDINYLRAQYFEALQKSTLGEYRRGVLLQRFRGENGAFFNQADLDYIQMHMRQPDYHIDILGKYKLNIYKHQIRVPDLTSNTPYFDMSIPYLIGIDCATGKDGDNTAFCILHPYTLEVVGELISPLMGGLDLMRTVTVLAKMLPRALFCIESNMTGVDVIDFVQESQLENRVYHGKQATELTKNVISPNDVQASLQQKATAKKYFGTYVGTKTRKMMFNILRDTVKDYRHLIYTQQLVHDIVNLVQQKNGNMAATSGEHDDMVMAYLHTLYILKYGEDLNRFGIDKNKCTFDKQKEIMDEYNQSVAENSVNNAIGLVPGTYEEQLYRDLTQRIHAEYSNPGDVDDYGYRRDQYQQSGDLKPTPSGTLTSSQLAFFREVNSYGYDDDMYGNPYACIGGSPYGYNNGNNGFGGGSPFGCF